MKYQGIREESVKKKVGQDFFDKFDTTDIIKNVDFAVKFRSKSGATLLGDEYLLWAEAKDGRSDIYASFVQLILTIGQSGTVAGLLPPPFLGAFDSERIAFIPYIDIADVFAINDFNWKVTPSNHNAKEFRLLYDRVQKIIEKRMYCYDFEKDETELRHFINNSLPAGRTSGKVQITKNNFQHIYRRWLEEVKPNIDFPWEAGKKEGILECDFYRADLFVDDKDTENVDDDTPIANKLSVIFRGGEYRINLKVLNDFRGVPYGFLKGGKQAYTAFWKKYKRPPIDEYRDFIIDRRDLLVHQDIRERKGSFFTPQKWVELSQQYIADVLNEDWQDEYYVWDCAAGTGNLLVGLSNKYSLWASTLDKADVDTMKELIKGGSLELLEEHVFQFDFLNDEFTKLPKGLQDIINDPKKRKRLVIYINPPYAEDTTKTTITGTGKNKVSVAQNKTHDKYADKLKKANHELFAQFLARIYGEIPTCKIANFSKLKNLQSSNFSDFRKFFRAKLEKIFVVPAATFDNVTGQFPIGFFIWDTEKKVIFDKITADVYDKNGNHISTKGIYANEHILSINKWIKKHEHKNEIAIGYMPNPAPDFQHNNQTFIQSEIGTVHVNYTPVSKSNLTEVSIYFAVRKCIEANWLNDRDQFFYPNSGWETDEEFHSDCLTYALFSNNIQAKHGVNHWIPFTEYEVGSRDSFDSNFMTDFIAGKLESDNVVAEPVLFYQSMFEGGGAGGGTRRKNTKCKFSEAAKGVFKAGKALWKYYHTQPNANVNASLYDIREHFQGRNDKGKMNSKSGDEAYTELIGNLRTALKTLAKKIEPKVYEYGFLKG